MKKTFSVVFGSQSEHLMGCMVQCRMINSAQNSYPEWQCSIAKNTILPSTLTELIFSLLCCWNALLVKQIFDCINCSCMIVQHCVHDVNVLYSLFYRYKT